VVDLPEPGAVALDRHVIGRVGKDHRGPFLAHHARKGRRIEDTAAQKFVIADNPEIAGLTDGGTRCRFGSGIGRVISGRSLFEAGDFEIDLADLETDNVEAEVELGDRQLLELLGEKPLVPLGVLGETVIGDHQGSPFGVTEPLDQDRRDLRPAQRLAGEEPAVPGDHVVLVIDKRGDGKAKGLYRPSELLDLLPAVISRIAAVRL
jgi:hypothetical protein